jgi:hypothetical protein
MKSKLIVFLVMMMVVVSPVAVLAQDGVDFGGSTSGNCQIGNNGTLFGLLCRLGQLINSVVPVLIALGVLVFVWGVIQYVVSDDEEAKKKGRDRIIFGIIGLAVIIGLWGLVNLLRNTFLLNNNTNVTLPTVPVVQ